MRSASSFKRGMRRAAMATRAPSAASASAVAAPMPEEAPVTRAVFPLSLPVFMSGFPSERLCLSAFAQSSTWGRDVLAAIIRPTVLSWPDFFRPSTTYFLKCSRDVDARNKSGHDGALFQPLTLHLSRLNHPPPPRPPYR